MTVLHCRNLDGRDARWAEEDAAYVQLDRDNNDVHVVTDKTGAFVIVADVKDLNEIGGCGKRFLSPSTKSALSRILDVPSCEGRDWRHLTESLGLGRYSGYLSTQTSPSEALLNLWETSNAENPDPIKHLAMKLKGIRREDAIVILERDL